MGGNYPPESTIIGMKSRRKHKPRSTPSYFVKSELNTNGLELLRKDVTCRTCNGKGRIWIDAYGNVYHNGHIRFYYTSTARSLRKERSKLEGKQPRNKWLCESCYNLSKTYFIPIVTIKNRNP